MTDLDRLARESFRRYWGSDGSYTDRDARKWRDIVEAVLDALPVPAAGESAADDEPEEQP